MKIPLKKAAKNETREILLNLCVYNDVDLMKIVDPLN